MSSVNPPHLWLRPGSTVYQARVRVPPSANLRNSHIVRSLRTRVRSEALKRLPVVVAEIRLEIEAARQAAQPGRPCAKRTEEARELEHARWWAQRIGAAGGDPTREEVPEALEAEWDRELEDRYGDPVGELELPGGEVSAVYAPEADARGDRFRAWVRGALPVAGELERYLTEKDLKASYRSRIKLATARLATWLRKEQGADNIRLLSTRTAALYVDNLTSGDITVETANSHVSALSAYWRWMVRRGLADQNPWREQQRTPKKTGRNSQKRSFTDEEVAALFSGETYLTLHDMMRLSILSGMRQDEVASLRVENVERKFFNITDAKTPAGVRRVPIHPSLKSLVARRTRGKAPTDFLLEELKAPPSREDRRGAKAGERFTAYRRDLGLDERLPGRRQANADFHSFRRWFITKLEQAGVAPQIIAAIVGHEEGRDFLALLRYSAGPSAEQLHDAVGLVRLPKGAPVASPPGPLMGSRDHGRRRGS